MPVTKPAAGDAGRKALIDAIIDELNALNGDAAALGDMIPNGSFELDTDADGIPDGWTRTLFTGGSTALITSDQRHGQKAFRFTSPGGAGNGGGYLETDFFEVSPLLAYLIRWDFICTVADVRVILAVRFFDVNQSFISSATIYDEATNNPTAWAIRIGGAEPPSTARYAKLRITGCDSSDPTAGSVTFDDVSMKTFLPEKRVEITTPGTHEFIAQQSGAVMVEVWGGGGGGGGGNGIGNEGGGGGGGGYARKWFLLTQGATYSLVVGAPGTGGSGAPGPGGAGGTSSFGGTVSATGGAGGVQGSAGTGGAGGTGSGGDVNLSGGDGQPKGGGGGAGGIGARTNIRAPNPGSGVGNPGPTYAAGGSGGGGTNVGGAGGAGLVRLTF
jgi:hypothetical protein